MCFISDGDGHTSLYASKVITKARKAHHCDECSEGIRVGESYHYVFSVCEGDPGVVKTCARCHWDRSRVYAMEIAEGCAEHESWPWHSELRQALHDRHMERSPITYRADPGGES